MTIAHARFSFFILFLLSTHAALAQPAPTAPMPKDPSALMSLAREKNGLTATNIKPWHIRGKYTFYDADGKAEDSGVYEEWWISDAKYERSFTGSNFTQVEYATETGLFRQGVQDWPSADALMLRSNLIEPLMDDETLSLFKLKQHNQSIGKVKLSCVILSYALRSNLAFSDSFFPESCFDPTQPVLRLNTTGSFVRTMYNQVVLFQGQYLAREMHVKFGDRPRVDLTLDVVETLKDPPDSLMVLPPDALPVDLSMGGIKLHAAQIMPALLMHAVPVYPESAKEKRVQGTVVVQATINQDGRTSNLRVISGPAELRQAALDAVRQWVYRPFRVLGKPTIVTSEVNVIFTLG